MHEMPLFWGYEAANYNLEEPIIRITRKQDRHRMAFLRSFKTSFCL